MSSHLFPVASSTNSIRYPSSIITGRPQVHRSATALLSPGWRCSPRPCSLFRVCQSPSHAAVPLPDSPDKPHAILRFMPQLSDPKPEYRTLELPLSTFCGYGLAFLFPLTHLPWFQFWVTSSFISPVPTAQLMIFPLYDIYNALPKCFPTLRGTDFISNFQLSIFPVLKALLQVTTTQY